MSITMTKKELATIAGYTYRRLYDIDRDLPDGKKLFVPGEDGKYDLATFVQKWVDYNVANEAPSEWDIDLVKAKHEVIKTQKTELEVAKMRGQLIDIQDIQKLWGDIANSVMQNFLHLSSKVSPMLRMQDNIEKINDIIDTEVRRILEDLTKIPVPDYAEYIEAENGGENGNTEPKGTV